MRPAKPSRWTTLLSGEWRRATALTLGLLFVISGQCCLKLDGAELKSLSSRERMRAEALRLTQLGVREIQKQRIQPPPLPEGLLDFRCIFHAHAEDSVHTGGTLPEMLADAKKAGVQAIFLSNHFRPPRDYMDAWRGLKDGVLFIPGSEVRGFLISPMQSIMKQMDAPAAEFISAVNSGDGLIFLSHIEERPGHSMEGLTGMEIYNRHYDAKRDMAGLIGLAMRLTSSAGAIELGEHVKRYPDELLASQVRRADDYLQKWDSETAKGLRLTGVAANDCHHNQILIVKMVDSTHVRVGTNVDQDKSMTLVSSIERPSILELTKGREPGDIVARVDLDPYHRSFRNVSTHVIANELSEAALRKAVKAGRAYVSHEWICDATGFFFSGEDGAMMGDEVRWRQGLKLKARTPAPCILRMFRNGVEVARAEGREIEHPTTEPGVYRVEATVVVEGDARPWIYSNPIYLR